jgi:hypothetical protein
MSYFVASLDTHGTKQFHLHTSGSVASSNNTGSPKFAYGLSTVKGEYREGNRELLLLARTIVIIS